MIDNWLIGFEAAMQPMPLLMLLVGVVAGIVIGALPGLTAVMGVAILLPFTFSLEPLSGMMMMVGLYTSAIYAGSIPAILMRVPGTPSSAAALLDGFPLAKKGRAGEALSVSLLSSMAGGLLGGLLLAISAPWLASVALKIEPGQYFMLIFLALTMIASISEGSMLKGMISGLLGLLLAAVGTDPMSGTARFTFGFDELRNGLDFIPVLIGLFGISQAFHQFERRFTFDTEFVSKTGSYRIPRKTLKRMWPGVAMGSPIGFFIGALPGGTGGEVGSFISYNETRRISKDKTGFGKGDPRGLAAAETGHNSAVPGTLAPTLTMGIPGNAVAAVMIGVLTVHGLQPGPQLFEGDPGLVYGVFWGFLIVPVVVGVIGLLGIRGWGMLLRIPPSLLWPAIVIMCVVGAYTIRSNFVDVWVMFIFGVIGYFMDRFRIPSIPLVIGMLVGPIAESGFRRATILAEGSFTWLFEPITFGLMVLGLLSIVLSVVRSNRLRRATRLKNRSALPGTERERRAQSGGEAEAEGPAQSDSQSAPKQGE